MFMPRLPRSTSWDSGYLKSSGPSFAPPCQVASPVFNRLFKILGVPSGLNGGVRSSPAIALPRTGTSCTSPTPHAKVAASRPAKVPPVLGTDIGRPTFTASILIFAVGSILGLCKARCTSANSASRWRSPGKSTVPQLGRTSSKTRLHERHLAPNSTVCSRSLIPSAIAHNSPRILARSDFSALVPKATTAVDISPSVLCTSIINSLTPWHCWSSC
mmetsp:Transcript_73414/g.116254  ORF Transcript_73414/g.116254 Transcript_73414/m.116254 type:complete len:216 (+) Transcript_73414:70-717(+)